MKTALFSVHSCFDSHEVLKFLNSWFWHSKVIKSFQQLFRLWVVPLFSSGIVERAKLKCAWKSPQVRRGDIRQGERKMRDYRQSPSFWPFTAEELHAPSMGPESRSCTLPLGRPVPRKAVKYYLKLCRVVIVAGAFLTDVDRFPWKSQSEFCVVRAMHKFKSLGFVCGPSFFSLPAACHLFSHGVIFTRTWVSLALLKWGTTRSLTTFAFFESSVLEMLFSLQRRFLAEETILHQLPP